MDDQSPSVWSRDLSDRESIWRAFRDLRDRADRVTLSFEGIQNVYSATVLEVDHRRVTLAGLLPRSGEILMNARRPFALSGRSQGALLLSPRNELQAAVPTADGPAYVMALPPRLLWQQRRQGPRYATPASLGRGRARITLPHADRPIDGVVQDLSSSGCRARFAAGARTALRDNAIFDGAQIDIAGLMSIRVRIVIRHRWLDPESGDIICGIRFTRIGTDDRLRLEQFLRSLARRANRS